MTMIDVVKGNLGQVRDVLGGPSASAIIDYQGANHTRAEVLPGVVPHWYLLDTHPGEDRIAAAHLIARRFGVYQPQVSLTEVKRGRKVVSKRAMFPGYLLVFVWDIEAHFARIVACPGVRGVVMKHIAPVGTTAPAVIADEVVDMIRSVENQEMADADAVVLATRKKRKRRRHYRDAGAVADVAEQPAIIGARPWSAFADGFMALDDDGRNRALRKLLGLSS